MYDRLVDHPLLHRFIEAIRIEKRTKSRNQTSFKSIDLRCGRQPQGVIVFLVRFRQLVEEGEYLVVLFTCIVVAFIGDEQNRFMLLQFLLQDVCKGVPS